MVVVLVCKTVISVVLGYRDYFPPNFSSDFLLGREVYFWSGYHWAFYLHLLSGPTSLLLGMMLMSDRLRQRLPTWHRNLGKLQIACVLFGVIPSGLAMAYHAATGTIAAYGLGSLAVVTAISISFGWRAAMQRNFAIHQRWMQRTFVLLCSAIVIRLIGGLATVAEYNSEWVYPFSVWFSWLGPLVIFEIVTASQNGVATLEAGR